MTHRLATRRDERGATAVEVVIVLPVLLALVLGILTGGEAYSGKIGVVEAVREGARFGASLALGTGPAAVADWEASVRNRVVSATAADLTADAVCVRLVSPIGGNDCGVPDPPGAAGESTVRIVKVSASRPAKLEFFLFSTTTMLTGEAAARYERDSG